MELPSSRAITTKTTRITRPIFICTSTPSDSRMGILCAAPFPLGEMLVQRAGNLFQCFQIRTIHGNNFAVEFSSFAKLQQGVKRGGMRPSEGRGTRNDIARRHRRLFSEGDHRVAQQRQRSREGFPEDQGKLSRVPVRAEVVLAQLQYQSPQVVFDLHAMKIHGDFNIRDDVLAIEHAPTLLYVENLDGKNISGFAQLVGGEEKGRRFLLVHAPPLHHGRQPSQLFDAKGVKNAGYVEIGESQAKIAACSGAEQDDAFEVRRSEFLQPVY